VVAADLGLSASDAFSAGVAGALCDDVTRARLAEIGRTAF
jgi:aminodeoxyfutalosine deaminase